MEYLTTLEVSKKWGISVRRVQFLCVRNMIPGTVKFAKAWAIPADAEKPRDGRYKAPAEKPDHLLRSCENIFGDEKLMVKIMECFPYPIQVSRLDGSLIFANEAFLKFFHIASKNKLIKEYNMFHDPFIANLGIKESDFKAFQGETVRLYDIKVPVQDIINKFGAGEICFNSIFMNVTTFPVYNEQKQLSWVVSIFITSKIYSGKQEIIKGKEYIENHWQEEFDITAVAKASGLSNTQFTRLFKNYTGFTPHRYYLNLKINMLKEKLLDDNLSITQAFSACGLDYNGHYAQVFKAQVGITPSAYRKSNR